LAFRQLLTQNGDAGFDVLNESLWGALGWVTLSILVLPLGFLGDCARDHQILYELALCGASFRASPHETPQFLELTACGGQVNDAAKPSPKP